MGDVIGYVVKLGDGAEITAAPEDVTVVRSTPGLVYLMWSNKYGQWWLHNAWGYTQDIDKAGRFTEAEATKYTMQSALSGDRTKVSYPVAAPDNWEPVKAAAPPVVVVAGPGPLRDVLPEALVKLAEDRAAQARAANPFPIVEVDPAEIESDVDAFMAESEPQRRAERLECGVVDSEVVDDGYPGYTIEELIGPEDMPGVGA